MSSIKQKIENLYGELKFHLPFLQPDIQERKINSCTDAKITNRFLLFEAIDAKPCCIYIFKAKYSGKDAVYKSKRELF